MLSHGGSPTPTTIRRPTITTTTTTRVANDLDPSTSRGETAATVMILNTTTSRNNETATKQPPHPTNLATASSSSSSSTSPWLPYDLWTNPTLFTPAGNPSAAVQFWTNLETVASVLYPAGAHLRPHTWIQNGVPAGCHVTPQIFDHNDTSGNNNNDTPCFNLCTHHGRYCAADPDGNLHVGLTGQDIVTESLRRLCIWKILEEENEEEGDKDRDHHLHPDGLMHKKENSMATYPYARWFAYMAEFQRHCYADTSSEEYTNHFRNPVCIQQVYRTIGLEEHHEEAIDHCMKHDNHLDDYDHEDLPSPLLDQELDVASHRGIYMVPTVQIPKTKTEGDHHDHRENPHRFGLEQEQPDNQDTNHDDDKKDESDDNDKKGDDGSHYHSIYGSDVTPQEIFTKLCSVWQLPPPPPQEKAADVHGVAAAWNPPAAPHVCRACASCPHVMHCLRSNGFSSCEANMVDDGGSTTDSHWRSAVLYTLVFIAVVGWAMWTNGKDMNYRRTSDHWDAQLQSLLWSSSSSSSFSFSRSPEGGGEEVAQNTGECCQSLLLNDHHPHPPQVEEEEYPSPSPHPQQYHLLHHHGNSNSFSPLSVTPEDEDEEQQQVSVTSRSASPAQMME
ncbi:hypothetical protein ACA910_001832 [Epithemia clementina (nom. ined.)]